MFKRLLVLAVVLGIGFSADAALKISVDGVVDEPDSTVTLMPSDVVVLGVWGDGQTLGPLDVWLVVEGPGTTAGGSMIYPCPVPPCILTYGPEPPGDFEELKAWLESIGFSNVNGISYISFADGSVPPAPLLGLLVDGIVFHCEAPGDVTISLIAVDEVGTVTTYDTQIIHQIPGCVTVPNVVGMQEGSACTPIEAASLTCTKTYQWHASIPKGQVISQNPAAGTCVVPGSGVALAISRGPQPIDCLANDVNQALMTTQKTSFTSYVNNRWDPNGWCRYGNVGAPSGAGYQCHGDADGKNTGPPFYYRVSTGDLNLVIGNWQKTLLAYPNGADPRADIDHKSTGAPFSYRVSTGDLYRIILNWQRGDYTVPGGLPRNCPLTDVNNNNYVKGSW